MADDSRPDDKPNTDQNEAELAERRRDFTRRALLRAGWVVPMVTTVNIPPASAQVPTPPPHNDVHGDSGHGDDIIEHLDVHLDTITPPHDDNHSDLPHSDTPHTDAPHDDHADGPHTDAPHTDTPHQDTHGDSHGDHGDHSDVHGDFSFSDHTDGGHSDHLDNAFHTDHADAITHSDHSDASGPGHLDSPPQKPPHGDHWDVQHRDHDDKNTVPPHDDHRDVPYTDHFDNDHRDHADAGSYQDHTDSPHTDGGIHNDHGDAVHIDAQGDSGGPTDPHADEHEDLARAVAHIDFTLHTDETHRDV